MAAPAQPQQKKTLLMTEGSIWKSILLFSVPRSEEHTSELQSR